MAKRYYDSRVSDGSYAGEYASRTQQMQDAGMIQMDRSEIANLPQGVMMKPWPEAGSYTPENLDDTITGVNRQIGEDDSKRNAKMKPKKVS